MDTFYVWVNWQRDAGHMVLTSIEQRSLLLWCKNCQMKAKPLTTIQHFSSASVHTVCNLSVPLHYPQLIIITRCGYFLAQPPPFHYHCHCGTAVVFVRLLSSEGQLCPYQDQGSTWSNTNMLLLSSETAMALLHCSMFSILLGEWKTNSALCTTISVHWHLHILPAVI